MARPTLFTQDLADDICEHLADGGSLRSWCREPGHPTFHAVYDWLAKCPAFADAYARARERQAHNDADRMSELVEAVMAGVLAPDVARVMMDALKWTAARRAPKAYGDKVSLSGDQDGVPIVVSWMGRCA